MRTSGNSHPRNESDLSGYSLPCPRCRLVAVLVCRVISVGSTFTGPITEGHVLINAGIGRTSALRRTGHAGMSGTSPDLPIRLNHWPRDGSVVSSVYCMKCPPTGGSHGKLHRTPKILSHARRRGGSVAAWGARAAADNAGNRVARPQIA